MSSLLRLMIVFGVLTMLTVGTVPVVSGAQDVRSSGKQPVFDVTGGIGQEPVSTVTGRGAFLFNTREGEPVLPERLRADLGRFPDYRIYVLQFIGPIRETWVETIRDLGVEVFDYLPEYAFIVAMSPSTIGTVRQLPFVRWLGTYHPAYKLSPTLLTWMDDFAVISISLFPGRRADRVAQMIATAGGDVRGLWTIWDEPWIRAVVPANLLVPLAHFPEVSWIEEYAPAAPANDRATWAVQTFNLNDLTDRRVHRLGIKGAGQLVAMADTGLDLDPSNPGSCHEVFRDTSTSCGQEGDAHRKIHRYRIAGACAQRGDETGHGTHMAGIIMGDAPPYSNWNNRDGHALGARLVVQDLQGGTTFCEPLDLTGMFGQAYADGARIHSNSWGSGVQNTYCDHARQADWFMWNNSNFLILFIAGNRQGTPEWPDFYTVSCEGNAKNIITVAATKNGVDATSMYQDCIPGSCEASARGPARDDRRKPTVLAPGQGVVSAQRGTVTGYVPGSGTSEATAGMAGAAVLVRQYFKDGWYPTGLPGGSPGFDPPASLVKAMLVNSGRDMPNDPETAYPSWTQGWGRIHLDDVLFFVENGSPDVRRLKVLSTNTQLNTGGLKTYHVRVTSSGEPLKATLVWTDYRGAGGSMKQIVNDLDLLVTSPEGQSYKGNVFCLRESGNAPGCTPDDFNRLDVEENVLRRSPSVGIWTIRVIAKNVPVGPQPFALVVTGALADVDPSLVPFVSPSNQTVYFNTFCFMPPVAEFTGSVTNPLGNYLYFWNFGDGGFYTQGPVGSPAPKIWHTYPFLETVWYAWLNVTESGTSGTKVGTVRATVYVEEVMFC